MATSSFSRTAVKKFINTVAAKTIGKEVGKAVSGPLLDLFGWSESDKQAQYFDSIMNRLDDIRKTLAATQNSIHEVQAAITDVRQDIEDAEAAETLDQLRPLGISINEKFDTYVEALKGLIAEDPVKNEEAAKELSNPLGVLNPHNISEIMTNGQDIFCPQHIPTKGLLDLQHTVLRSAISRAARPEPIFWDALNHQHPGRVQSEGGFWRCDIIIPNGHEAAYVAVQEQIADTIRWFVTVQLKGLILLSSAWYNSIHETRVGQHCERLIDIFHQIDQFIDSLPSTIDQQVASCLREHGKFLRPPITDGQPPWHTYTDQDNWHDIPYPFSDNYIMWNTYGEWLHKHGDPLEAGYIAPYNQDGTLMLVEKPWEYGQRPVATIQGADTQDGLKIMFKEIAAGSHPYYYANVSRYNRPLPGSLEFAYHLSPESEA